MTTIEQVNELTTDEKLLRVEAQTVPIVTEPHVLKARMSDEELEHVVEDADADNANSRREILRALVGSSKKERVSNFIAGVACAEDVRTITRMADDDDPITLRLTFGASEAMPLRAVSYPLPAFKQMMRLKEIGRSSFLQITFANHVSGTLNGLDKQAVALQTKDVSLRVFDIAADLGLVSQIGFNTDRPEDVERARDLASSLTIPKEIDAILPGRGRPVREAYIAAHILQLQTDYRPLTFAGQVRPEFGHVIDTGCLQETRFTRMRHAMCEEGTVPPFIFTRHIVPPYYFAKHGDIGLDEPIPPVEQVDPALREDVRELIRATGIHNV